MIGNFKMSTHNNIVTAELSEIIISWVDGVFDKAHEKNV